MGITESEPLQTYNCLRCTIIRYETLEVQTGFLIDGVRMPSLNCNADSRRFFEPRGIRAPWTV